MHKFSPGGAREQLSGAWRLTTLATLNEKEEEEEEEEGQIKGLGKFSF